MTREIDHSTREAHPETTDSLQRMVIDLEITIKAKETIGTVQRRSAIAVLEAARTDVEQCREPGILMHAARGIAEPAKMATHMRLILWINNLSIDLKLMEQGLPKEATPITVERLEAGKRLINELPQCRKSLKFY